MKRPLLHLLKWRREWLWLNQCWKLPCNTNPAKSKHSLLHGVYSIFSRILTVYALLEFYSSCQNLTHHYPLYFFLSYSIFYLMICNGILLLTFIICHSLFLHLNCLISLYQNPQPCFPEIKMSERCSLTKCRLLVYRHLM